MESIVSYLSSVPDVIWAAIIASLLTLSGVTLTNRHYSKQQRAQLSHENALNQASRKFTMREGVYLAAAEELTVAFQQLTNLSSVDVAKTNPADRLAGFFIALSKASLVASDETARAISDFMIGFSGAFFDLLSKIGPIQEARTDRDIYDSAHEQHQNEVSRILASMTQFNEEAKANSDVWNALQRSLEFNMQQSEIAAESRTEAWDRLNEQKQIFLRDSLPIVKEVSKLTVPALVAIRAELGISTDIEAYRADFENRFAKIQEQLEEFLANITSDAA